MKGATGNGSNRDHTWIAVSVSNLPEISKALKKRKKLEEKLPAGLNPMPRIPSHLKSRQELGKVR